MPRDTDTYADSLGSKTAPTLTRVALNYTHNSSATRLGFIEAIRQALADAGWQQTATGSYAGFPYYDMLSQQSPWWDELATPPADYIGKIKLRVQRNDDGSNASRIEVVGRSADDLFVQAGFQSSFPIAAATTYRVVACPYQLVAQRADGGSDGNVIASALHTSRFQQETGQYRECFFLSSNYGRTTLSSGTNVRLFAKVKNRQGTFQIDLPSFSANNGTRMVMLTTAGGSLTAPRLINVAEDPTYANSALWYPMYSPAMVAWGDNPVNSLQIGSVKIRGWFWDCINLVGIYPAGHRFTRALGEMWEAYTVNSNNGTLFFRTQ